MEYFCFIFVLPNFRDIQLVIIVLSHRCNSPTDLGEANFESHAFSETKPCQAALLLDILLALDTLLA